MSRFISSFPEDDNSAAIQIKVKEGGFKGCLTTFLIIGLVAGNLRQCSDKKSLKEENLSLREKIEKLEASSPKIEVSSPSR